MNSPLPQLMMNSPLPQLMMNSPLPQLIMNSPLPQYNSGPTSAAGSYTIPYVIEKTPAGERSFDIYSRLLQERIIFVGTEIDDGVANVVMAQLLHLADVAPDREVSLYINSPGGSFTSLMAMYDTMQFVPTPVATFCLGQAASAAAVLLAVGEPGRRFALRHSRVLLHQPSAGGQGTVSDLALQADELLRVRAQVEEVLSRHTGRSTQQLRVDTDRDRVLTASEAVTFGIVDEVIERASQVEQAGGAG